MKIKFLNIFSSYGGKDYFAKRILYIYFRMHLKEEKCIKISLTGNKNYEFEVNTIKYLNKEGKRKYLDFTVINAKSVVGVILYD